MKNKYIVWLIIFVYLLLPKVVLADATGLCPIPQQYKVAMDGQVKDNAVHGCSPIGKALYQDNISSEPKNSTSQASFVINENETHRFKFVAYPAGVTPSQINQGDLDSTTTDHTKWQPKEEIYHPRSKDVSPVAGNNMKNHPCYTWLGIQQNKWDQKGWKVNTVNFVYHMDSPTKYGNCGHIGFHLEPGESVADGGADGKSEFNFSYRVPSVPIWYVVSSGINISWDWAGTQVQHPYKANHICCPRYYPTPSGPVPCPTCGGAGCCIKCRKLWVLCEPENIMNPCYSNPQTVNAKDWKPKKILTDIEEPQAAKSRISDTNYCDENGVPSSVYSVPNAVLKPGFENQPITIARATVRVKDTGNVAHVQIGLQNKKSNLIKGICGKKLSEGEDGDAEVTFRIVDNAVHANKLIVCDNGEKNCAEGDWDENEFKIIFWYEVPLYQYASYYFTDVKDPNNAANLLPVYRAVYSPMFVWKKHVICNSLTEFFNKGGIAKVYWYAGNPREQKIVIGGNTDDRGNGTYIVYEMTKKISELFKPTNDDEDILPWHYAETSLGDNFGNPPYSKDVSLDLYNTIKDKNGQSIVDKFKYKPFNYKKGKGPLKYFIEVHDGSKLTKGGGRKKDGADKFTCKDEYFKENDYLNYQLRYNPDVVKYIQYPSVGTTSNQGEEIDPTNNPNQACLAEDYEDNPKQYYDWTKIKELRDDCLCKDDEPMGVDEILKYFQMWGKVSIKDTMKPNIGIRIEDTTKGTVRRVYRLNDDSNLEFYGQLLADQNKTWALVDNNTLNYSKLVQNAKPRAPFSLNDDSEKLWEFKNVQLLINSSSNGKLWEGKDYEGNPPNRQDSMMPYGTAEDTKLEITHQDLYTTTPNFCSWYAHDNIDGQRIIVKPNNNPIKKDDWYKGVVSMDFESENDKTPTFPDDYINKGYTSWIIKDETYVDQAVFDQMYKVGNYFRYPDITFNNPNRKWDGNTLPNGEKEISVAYGVMDKAGNKRKIKVYFYIAPLDMKILTIEKQEKRKD